jgi:hypothetical protein
LKSEIWIKIALPPDLGVMNPKPLSHHEVIFPLSINQNFILIRRQIKDSAMKAASKC